MELYKIKVKNKNQCECGHVFTIEERTSDMIKNEDYHFYGGRAEYFANAKCPECGEEYILIIESANNGYKVFDISDKEKQEAEVGPIANNEGSETEVSDEFKCEKCNRTFKNKSGLSSHKRKCL